ncbi:hypothetical protein CHS0354_002591 [Potamilus streckersoni]|uniref:THD domain-containing protein n=1 Tax=Potamilus streckersoni TaxID=2493646 RepID=A0AAE0RNM2_9BIVA|nr:hypothetical protein CHS0354_002591 [Potamilus streckersoni]
MERCQSETSVKIPELCTTSTTNLLDQVLSSSALMSGHSLLQIGDYLPGYQSHPNSDSSSRWGSRKESEFSKSSTISFLEQRMPSLSPTMSDRPISKRENHILTGCDKCSSEVPPLSRGPEKSYINRISVMILSFLVILSCIGSAVACAFLKQLIDRCNDLETKLNNAQSTYTQGLHEDQEFCLPCAELVQGPFEEDNLPLRNLTRKTVDGIVTCCGRTPSQFSVILDLYIGQKQKEKCAQENLKSTSTPCTNITGPAGQPIGTPISAHLVAGLQGESAIEQTYQPIRNWKLDNETTHISGMELVNDRLQALESGTYFVYSQVGFEIQYQPNEDIEIAKQTLYHHLNRYNPIYPNGGSQILAKGAATQCWEQIKEFGHYTSYAGVTVKLNKGDQLYIIVSQAYISRDPKRTYFGAYKIY